MNKVAIVTGASRGIGRKVCHKLAENGYNVVIAAKSIKETKNLPGTIYSVHKEIQENYDVKSLPLQIDVRDCTAMKHCVNNVIDEFGKIDFLFNNAGALWWKNILETPPSKYDLINDINVRASFILSEAKGVPHLVVPRNDGKFDIEVDGKLFKTMNFRDISDYIRSSFDEQYRVTKTTSAYFHFCFF